MRLATLFDPPEPSPGVPAPRPGVPSAPGARKAPDAGTPRPPFHLRRLTRLTRAPPPRPEAQYTGIFTDPGRPGPGLPGSSYVIRVLSHPSRPPLALYHLPGRSSPGSRPFPGHLRKPGALGRCARPLPPLRRRRRSFLSPFAASSSFGRLLPCPPFQPTCARRQESGERRRAERATGRGNLPVFLFPFLSPPFCWGAFSMEGSCCKRGKAPLCCRTRETLFSPLEREYGDGEDVLEERMCRERDGGEGRRQKSAAASSFLHSCDSWGEPEVNWMEYMGKWRLCSCFFPPTGKGRKC